jgi:hypothetical protein
MRLIARRFILLNKSFCVPFWPSLPPCRRPPLPRRGRPRSGLRASLSDPACLLRSEEVERAA